MNKSNAQPPALPGQLLNDRLIQTDAPPIGELPGDRAPITGLASAVESILREPRRVLFHIRQPRSATLLVALFLVFVICSAVYGTVVGTFTGGVQLWAAPLKITGGILFAGLICLPSLYIFTCLGGCQARLVEILGVLAGLITLTAVLLLGFAPVAWVFSQSTSSVAAMGVLHLIFGLVAACFGLRFLHWSFGHLKVNSAAGIKVWMLIFVVVTLQMTTALRPIIGRADTLLPVEKKFFVAHWLENLRQK
jgi:hypothetical protein